MAPSLLDTKSVYNRSSSPEDMAMDQGPTGLRDSYEEPMDFEEFKKGRPLREVSFGWSSTFSEDSIESFLQ